MEPSFAPLPAAGAAVSRNTFISFLLIPLTLVSFYLLPQLIGKTAGYLGSFAIYWLFCLLHGFRLKGGSVAKLYTFPALNKQNILLTVLCFIPAIGAFTASFSQAYSSLNASLYLLLISAALFNGFVEEFYWRSAFISRYKKDIRLAYFLPTVLFGLWHISVYVAYGVEYQGGFLPLVGGAFFMGIIWGYTAYRQQRTLIPTLAHVLTNFFAFSYLLVENWIK